jgi:hypothetical protein
MAGMGVTYRYPVTGATPPTALQAKCEVVVDVACGAGATDDDTDIIHNFGLSPTDGSDGRPQVSFALTAAGAAAALTVGPKFVFKDANTVTVKAINKGANCDWTARITMWRPHTVIR